MTSPSRAGSSSRSRQPSPPPEETPPLEETPPPSNPLLEEPAPSLLFSQGSSPTSPPADDGASWDVPGESPTGSLDDGEDSGSRPRSTGGRAARKRAVLEVVTTALVTAGGMAHQLLTREGSGARQIGLFLPDEDDLEAIGDPAAGIASRRAPAGVENPDVSDGVRLALGVFGYVMKQRAKLAALAAEAAFTGGTDEEPDAGAFGPENPVTVP